MSTITGILLAGGLSRRYGSPKAFAKINGQYFYEQTYALLQCICDHVVIVTRPEFVDWFKEDEHVIVDVESYQGCGPLAGIYSGMNVQKAKHYMVLPCDMPLIQKEALQKLYQRHQSKVTIASVQEREQPLVSVWNRSMMEPIKTALEQGQYALKDVLNQYDITKITDDQLTNNPITFSNINTAEEDKEMRNWLKS